MSEALGDEPREHFTHRSQSLGDTAHQLIGAAKVQFWSLILLWSELNDASRNSRFMLAERLRSAGDALWKSSEQVAGAEKSSLIQYFIWTVETQIFSMLSRAALTGGAQAVRAINLHQVLEELLDAVKDRGINYPHVEQEIRTNVVKYAECLQRLLAPQGSGDVD